MNQPNVIRPQDGYQMLALSSPADIVIGGGAAGVGKTFCLLLEVLRHQHVENFGAVVFRRTYPMIRAEGGLWDASNKLYGLIPDATPRESFMEWTIGKAKLKFAHMQHEKNKLDWQGSEIPLICFDELTHFSKTMFFYLLTRNRSTCGVKPYVRATCNPDPDSWVAELIEWWIDQETGFPIPERQGVVRYFMLDNDKYIWGFTPQEVIEKGWHVLEKLVMQSGVNPLDFVKSITFIGGSIFDNKELLSINPQYLANLASQPAEIRAQLLEGNWKVKVSGNDIYDFYAFNDIFTNSHVKPGRRRITADIALKGSNLYVAYAWEGRRLLDFIVYPKVSGKGLVTSLKAMAVKHRIPNSRILFDNDGAGAFIDGEDGFIPYAREFNNNSRPFPNPIRPARDPKGKPMPENYANLKTQCYYRSGDAVGRGEYYIPPELADRKVDDKRTLKQALIEQRKAIKRGNVNNDGKLTLNPKTEQMVLLNGDSPDFLDAFMMNEWFELQGTTGRYVTVEL